MEPQEQRSLSGLAFLVIAVASGCLTWLCVSWFGAQEPLTAAVAVILVELFLACFVMIAVLLAERLSASYLSYEQTHLEKPAAPRRMWLWRPLWQPQVRFYTPSRSSALVRPPVSIDGWLHNVHREMTSLGNDPPTDRTAGTVPFPGRFPVASTESVSTESGSTYIPRRAA